MEISKIFEMLLDESHQGAPDCVHCDMGDK